MKTKRRKFTKEQEDYLLYLIKRKRKVKDIHRLFNVAFATDRSSNSIRVKVNKLKHKYNLKVRGYTKRRTKEQMKKHDEIILECVRKTPNNKLYAFSVASKKTGVKEGTICERYYSHVKYQDLAMSVGSNHMYTYNVKNTPRNKDGSLPQPKKQISNIFKYIMFILQLKL